MADDKRTEDHLIKIYTKVESISGKLDTTHKLLTERLYHMEVAQGRASKEHEDLEKEVKAINSKVNRAHGGLAALLAALGLLKYFIK